MNKKQIFVILLLVFFSVFLLMYKFSTVDDTLVTEVPEDLFATIVGESVNLNDAITINAENRSITLPEEKAPLSDYYRFQVIMHGSENIIFDNTAYGLRTFKKTTTAEGLDKWEEVYLKYTPFPSDVVLYADANDQRDHPVSQTVRIFVGLLQAVDLDSNIRFYVSGIGEETSQEYGAYIDVEIIHP